MVAKHLIVPLLGMGSSIRRQDEALLHSEQPDRALKSYKDVTRADYIKGVFGNLGMYASGIPVGLLVDSKGPRPGVLMGSTLLGSGYFSLHRGTAPSLSLYRARLTLRSIQRWSWISGASVVVSLLVHDRLRQCGCIFGIDQDL